MPPHTIAALPVPVSPSAIATFCQLNAICKLSLFGSVLRTDFTPESDVDVLVEFASGHTPGLAIVRLARELSPLLGERTIDLRTPQELSRYCRDRVLSEAMTLYEQPR
ncbi:MAG: nucleotidyltransferase domain-containing protein [Cyanobacteria bacterium P01_C01_bin.120]